MGCTESSDADCQCDGQCDDLRTIGVNTQTMTTTHILTSTMDAVESRSHTFNILDVEVYATFTLLWLFLFAFSLLFMWRLQALDFFRVCIYFSIHLFNISVLFLSIPSV